MHKDGPEKKDEGDKEGAVVVADASSGSLTDVVSSARHSVVQVY